MDNGDREGHGFQRPFSDFAESRLSPHEVQPFFNLPQPRLLH